MSIAVELPRHVAAEEAARARRSKTVYRANARRSCARTAVQRGSAPAGGSRVREIPTKLERCSQPSQQFRPFQREQRGQRGTLPSVPGALLPPVVEQIVVLDNVGKPTHAAERPATRGVRLTHRGQVAVLLASALLALVVVAGSWTSQRADSPRASVPPPAHVAVVSGDTLWSIARQVAPTRDPRAEVDDLLKLNKLADARLVPGQVLRVR